MNRIFPGIPFVESPIFEAIISELGWTEFERQVALDLHERGYAVIDFPDPEIEHRVERIKNNLGPQFGINPDDLATVQRLSGNDRIQDAWRRDEDVRVIATNTKLLNLLAKLYGREPFPFQTLNFPVGTQQPLHSDSIHFSSIPERFMCGVWLAMEDVHPDAGPLTYLPGSNRWPIVTNAMIGRRGSGSELRSAQIPFETAWDAMISVSGQQQDLFVGRKGQALIWAANLLHGGSPRRDLRRTRWSQVTHYYFKDCVYYTPAFSDEPIGQLNLREATNIVTGLVEPNLFLGQEVLPIDPASDRRVRPRRWPWRTGQFAKDPKIRLAAGD